MTLQSIGFYLFLLAPLFFLLNVFATRHQEKSRHFFLIEGLASPRKRGIKGSLFLAITLFLLGAVLWIEGKWHADTIYPNLPHVDTLLVSSTSTARQILIVLDTNNQEETNTVLNTLTSIQDKLQGSSFALLSTYSTNPLLVPPTYDLAYTLMSLDSVTFDGPRQDPNKLILSFLSKEPYSYSTLTIIFTAQPLEKPPEKAILFALRPSDSLAKNFAILQTALLQFKSAGSAATSAVTTAAEQLPSTLMLIALSLFLFIQTLFPESTLPFMGTFYALFFFISPLHATSNDFSFTTALISADDLVRRGEYPAAEKQLLAALSQGPSNNLQAYFLYNLGLVEAHLGRYQIALDHLSAIAINSPLIEEVRKLQKIIVGHALVDQAHNPSAQLLDLLRPLANQNSTTAVGYQLARVRLKALAMYQDKAHAIPLLFLCLQRAVAALAVDVNSNYFNSVKQELLTYSHWSGNPAPNNLVPNLEQITNYPDLVAALDNLLQSNLIASEQQEPITLLLQERALAFVWQLQLPASAFIYQSRSNRVSNLLGLLSSTVLSEDPESDLYYWQLRQSSFKAGPTALNMLSSPAGKAAVARYFPLLTTTSFTPLNVLRAWVDQNQPYPKETEALINSLLQEAGAQQANGSQDAIIQDLPETLGIILHSAQPLKSTADASTLLLQASEFLLQTVTDQRYDLGSIGLLSALQSLNSKALSLHLPDKQAADFTSLSTQGMTILKKIITDAEWEQRRLVEDHLFQVSRILEQLFTLLQPPISTSPPASASSESGQYDPIALYQLLERRDRALLQEATAK